MFLSERYRILYIKEGLMILLENRIRKAEEECKCWIFIENAFNDSEKLI